MKLHKRFSRGGKAPFQGGSLKRSGRRAPAWKRALKRSVLWSLLGVLALHMFWAVALVGLRFVNPFTTGVQIQRRVESLLGGAVARAAYTKRANFVPLEQISVQLRHAVVAAEDGRFYSHHGIDFEALQEAVEDSVARGENVRGASTITQQLVKNLFFTTHRNPVRKAAEFTLAPMADVILGKHRVLELYLNIVEWGPGVYGIDAATRYHYGTGPGRLSRDQASRLAACLPLPLRRRPQRMDRYSAIIRGRMAQMNW